jgi:hypothetical protein
MQGPLLPGASSVDDDGLVNVNGVSVSTTVKSHKPMGDAYVSPNFSACLALLTSLVASSTPPSGSTTSRHQLPPAVPLAAVDLDMVTCAPFTRLLFKEFVSGAYTRVSVSVPRVSVPVRCACAPSLGCSVGDGVQP